MQKRFCFSSSLPAFDIIAIFFLFLAILMGIKSYIFMVLIYISLMANDV